MANILFLVHRLPYPPNKGDKVRSYNLLKHLLKQHRVFLGTFIDTPEDEQHIATLRSICPELHVVKLNPRFAKIRSLNGLLVNEPLTLRYYRDSKLQNWVDNTCKHHHIAAAVVFCSAMAQYVEKIKRLPILIDFVDLDSAKWAQYAPRHRWPMSWIYKREGELLLSYERQIATQAARCFFVTEPEVSLFINQAPECSVRAEVMSNGVDVDYFTPDPSLPSPFGPNELPIVFTGTMDHWPNIDAARWFSLEVLPSLLQHFPLARFYIVGRSPKTEVTRLASESVVVTGTVPDIRPYLQHAAVVVAPLRVARGIQNKILEGMAMARPIIAAAECAAAVDAEIGKELIAASSPAEYLAAIQYLLANPEAGTTMGHLARARVVVRYSWDAHMSVIDPYLMQSSTNQPA